MGHQSNSQTHAHSMTTMPIRTWGISTTCEGIQGSCMSHLFPVQWPQNVNFTKLFHLGFGAARHSTIMSWCTPNMVKMVSSTLQKLADAQQMIFLPGAHRFRSPIF
jgi:hypothetical protein